MENTYDPLVTCPLDEAHRIRKSRLPFHLLKCKRNHNLSTKAECPYDARHLVDKLEFEHHKANCPSSGNVKNFKYRMESEATFEPIPVEAINQQEIPRTENWDLEPAPVTSYISCLNKIEDKNILITPMAIPKSKKKQIRLSERMRHSNLQNNAPLSTVPVPAVKMADENKPLRSPRKPPQELLHNTVTEETINAALSLNNTSVTIASLNISVKNETAIEKEVDHTQLAFSRLNLKGNESVDSNKNQEKSNVTNSTIVDYSVKENDNQATDNEKNKSQEFVQPEIFASRVLSALKNDSVNSLLTAEPENRNENANETNGNASSSTDVLSRINSKIALLSDIERSIAEEKAKLQDSLKKIHVQDQNETQNEKIVVEIPPEIPTFTRNGVQKTDTVPRCGIGRGFSRAYEALKKSPGVQHFEERSSSVTNTSLQAEKNTNSTNGKPNQAKSTDNQDDCIPIYGYEDESDEEGFGNVSFDYVTKY